MKQDQKSQHAATVRIAKAILTAGLLLGLLCATLPLELVSAAASCKLACCVRKSPHAAGSCAGDSCPMGPQHAAKSTHDEVSSEAAGSDRLCGAEHAFSKIRHARKAVAGPGAASRIDNDRLSTNHPPQVKTAANQTASVNELKATCNRDCGCCAQASIRTRRGRELAIISMAHHPRPPIKFGSAFNRRIPFGNSDALRASIRPRAPPTLLS